MTKVKICGLQRKEDINYLNELKPDYGGFVFAKSNRQVSLSRARELIGLLDKSIKTVGVFQDEKVEKVIYAAEYLNLDVIQLHGSENESYIKKMEGLKVWKAVAVDIETSTLMSSIDYETEGILLDSQITGIIGGTGLSFDWNIITKLNIKKKLILAGGLNCENIENAISKAKPYAVDVSSGVEENGIKSYVKLKKFIDKVRNGI